MSDDQKKSAPSLSSVMEGCRGEDALTDLDAAIAFSRRHSRSDWLARRPASHAALRTHVTTISAAILAVLLVTVGAMILLADHQRYVAAIDVQARAAIERAYTEITAPLKTFETYSDTLLAVVESIRDREATSGGRRSFDQTLDMLQAASNSITRIGATRLVVVTETGGVLRRLEAPDAAPPSVILPRTIRYGVMHVSDVLNSPLPSLRRIDVTRTVRLPDGEIVHVVISLPPGLFRDALTAAAVPLTTVMLVNTDREIIAAAGSPPAGRRGLRPTGAEIEASTIDQLEIEFALDVYGEITDRDHGIHLVQMVDHKAATRIWLSERGPIGLLILTVAPLLVIGGAKIDRRAADALFRGIVEMSATGIVEVDEQGVILYANEAMHRFLGLSAQDGGGVGNINGQPLDRVFLAPDHEVVQQMLAGALAAPVTARVMGNDGRILEMDVTMMTSPVATGDRPKHRVLSLTDVTARSEALRARAEAAEAARQASIAKSRFLSYTSHDLRQPATVITIMAGRLVKRDLSPEKVKEIGRHLETAGMVLRDMIEGLMTYSRLSSGAMDVTLSTFDLVPHLRKMVEAAETACEKPISFDLRLPEVAIVTTDRALMVRVIQNIMTNAVKYTERGRVTVAVDTEVEAKQQVAVTITDTGIGMTPETRARVFDEYWQAENSARDFTQGFGLGLTIVRQIIDLLGHGLSLESEPGQGTTVTIRIGDANRPTAAERDVIGIAPTLS